MPKGAEMFIQHIAKSAGETIMKRFGSEGVHRHKSDFPWDVVTKADLLSEKLIISAIREKYPTHQILAEESGAMETASEYLWIIDPIDGTLAFATNTPTFGVMIALAHKGKVLLSVIYLPATKELYFAKKGAGAYRNGKKISCSRRADWAHSIGFLPGIFDKRAITFMKRLMAEAEGKRIVAHNMGSVALNATHVAVGRRDWYMSFNAKTWDYAPAALLLSEAGCKATNGKGKPWQIGDRELIAGTPRVHKQLLKLAKGI